MVALEKLADQVGARPVKASQVLDAQLSTLTADSSQVTAGALFAAIPGAQVHGAQFALQAIDSGAVAIFTDAEGVDIIARDSNGELMAAVYVVENIEKRLGEIAAAFYSAPADKLRSFGVTGTNGKTTTTYMLEHLLTDAGHLTALVGGVQLRIGGVHTDTSITTPLPIDLQRMLAQHVAAGGTEAVMEVTSHALEQHRTDPIRFDVAGFTQLSIDHLDYHPSVEDYFNAKAELFRPERCKAAVILIDDEWGQRLFKIAVERGVTTYALAVESVLPTDVEGWQVRVGEAGAFTITDAQGATEQYSCGLPGTYNIANAALAITMLLTAGVPRESIGRTVSPQVPGRMEVISADSPRVIVDFAHNADALAKALIALRPTTKGRLIAVTGTAGDRDATKRFAMGEATAVNADVVVITDDDPHTEDPQQIRNALIEGTVGHSAQVIEIADRSEAIHEAIRLADANDTVVIAGRGHWTVQFVGHDLVALDDREVAREALAERSAHQNQR